MKRNKVVNAGSKPDDNNQNDTAGIDNNNMFSNGLWMEFEDSFIQHLAGFEPKRKYYNNAEINQLQASC